MPRWEEDSLARLEGAALELFSQAGYERTTVAQIAKRAGLAERSFFRHYRDKRAVLFSAYDELEHHVVTVLERDFGDDRPFGALVAALSTAEPVLRPREVWRERAAVISASPALRERELMVLASLSRALETSLACHGVEPRASSLAADLATLAFRRSLERWARAPASSFAAVIAETSNRIEDVVLGDPMRVSDQIHLAGP